MPVPEGRRDVQPRHARVQPHHVHERLPPPPDRARAVRGVPAGDRRGAEQLAEGGAARAGRRGPELRPLQDPEARRAGDVQLPSAPTASNDQVYIGWDKEGGHRRRPMGEGCPLDRRLRRDVSRARSRSTVFTASDGGHTEDLNVQWGTPLAAVPVPGRRLRPRRLHDRQPVDRLEPGVHAHRAHDRADAVHRRHRRGGRASAGSIAASPGASRMPWSAGAAGEATVSGGELRSALALPDDRVWINADKNVVGAIRSEVRRPDVRTGSADIDLEAGPRRSPSDVRVGSDLSQRRARRHRVAQGRDIRGVPDRGRRVRASSGSRSRIRAPSGRSRQRCPGGCSRADFVDGRIYWKEGVGRVRPLGERAHGLQPRRRRRWTARIPDVATRDT